jgi:hypothetical protein
MPMSLADALDQRQRNYSIEVMRLQEKVGNGDPAIPEEKQARRRSRLNDLCARLIPDVVGEISEKAPLHGLMYNE